MASSEPVAVVDKHLSMLRLDNPSNDRRRINPAPRKRSSLLLLLSSSPASPRSLLSLRSPNHKPGPGPTAAAFPDPTTSPDSLPNSNLPPSPKKRRRPQLGGRFCSAVRGLHTLHRCVSDSASSPAAKSVCRTSSSSGDGDDACTPNTKRRRRRIKDRFREMTIWLEVFEQVMLVDAEEEGQIINTEPTDELVQDLDNTAAVTKDCDQKRFEESVSVENVGQCIVIHFSCHCGVPYQLLLAGGNCYYKLM